MHCGFFTGIYGLKYTNQWRHPIWKPTHLRTVTPSGCPISPRTVGRIRIRMFGDLWLYCTTATQCWPHGVDLWPIQDRIVVRGSGGSGVSSVRWFHGGSAHTALLNRVESKAFRLINSSPLTDCLQPLSHRRSVDSLALFYRYFHANCSSDLSNCVPPLLPRPRCTRFASSSHPYSVYLSNARVNQYSQSFIPFSGKLWNSLPAYDLICFKREVSRHLSQSSIGYWIWTFQGPAPEWAILFYFCCPWPPPFYIKKKALNPYFSDHNNSKPVNRWIGHVHSQTRVDRLVQ